VGSLAEVIQAFETARSVVLTSQSPLDGDSVGCEVALLAAAPALMPEARVTALNESLPSAQYAFLSGVEKLGVLGPDEEAPRADLLVVLDCGDLRRFAYLPQRFPDARVMNIDHHASNSGFGHIAWVAPDRASTAEQIYEILRTAGVPLSRDTARALYAAMVFDTGRFAYSNTRPETHRYAADLLDLGVRPEATFRALYRNRSPAALKMMGFAIETLQLAADGALAWIQICQADMERAGAEPEDLEELVNLPMTLANVEVSMLFREIPGDRIKVSLRSDRWFDVADFAGHFGGGGHVRAAGLTLSAPLDSAVQSVTQRMIQALQDGKP